MPGRSSPSRPALPLPLALAASVLLAARGIARAQRRIPLLSAIALSIAAPPAAAQSAEEVLRTAVQLHQERMEGVDDYTLVQEVMGQRSLAYFERRDVEGESLFVRVSRAELLRRGTGGAGDSGLPGGGPVGTTPPGPVPPGATRPAADAGPGLEEVRDRLVRAAAQAGLQAVAGEIASATDEKLGGLLASLPSGIGAAAGGGSSGGETDGVDAAGGRGLKDALLRAAGQAGMAGLASALTGASGEEVSGLLDGLRGPGGLPDPETLKNLAGGLGGGRLPGLPGGGPGGGAAPGGPGMPGGMARAPQGVPFGGVGGGGDVSQRLLMGAAQAGMGALMGAGVRALMSEGVTTAEPSTGAGLSEDPYALMERLAAGARLAGTDAVDGHETWVIVVDDASGVDFGDETAFSPTSMTLHLDREDHVPRRVILEGELELEGERRPVTIRSRLRDYREVGGLLQPFRTVTLLEGVHPPLSEEEREEMRKAGERLEEMDERMAEARERLADLPPAQRAMAERMMEQRMPDMERVRRQVAGLAGGGPMELTSRILEVRVNEGPPRLPGMQQESR